MRHCVFSIAFASSKRACRQLKRVEKERELASLYADAQVAIEKERWTEASKVLAEIKEIRPNYREADELEQKVREHRGKRKRRAQRNALIIMATNALLGCLSGVWLAQRLAVLPVQTQDWVTIGALAAMSGLATGGFVGEIGTTTLGGRRESKVFLLRIGVLSWMVTVLVTSLIIWLGQRAGNYTQQTSGNLIGLYLVVAGWGIMTTLGGLAQAISWLQGEPPDPTEWET